MKKNILFLIIVSSLLGSMITYGQQTPPPVSCYYDPDWDWMSPTMTIYTTEHPSGFSIGSPFLTPTMNNDIYSNVYMPQDFKKNQGWVLLSKDFGCSNAPVMSAYPYFMLYNRYRGIIRTFIYSDRVDSHTSGFMKLKWSSPAVANGLLSTTHGILKPYQNYVGSMNNQDYMLQSISDYLNRGAWIMTENVMSFDPNTDPNTKMSIIFDLNSVDQTTVTLAGEFSMTTNTKGVTEPQASENTVAVPWNLEARKNVNKYLGMIPSSTEMLGYMKNVRLGVAYSHKIFNEKFAKKLEYAEYKMYETGFPNQLYQFAKNIPQIGSTLTTIFDIVDFFVGKPSETALNVNPAQVIQPTVSTSEGIMSLKGTITGQSLARSIPLQVPGTYHHFGSSWDNVGLPFYDCPLGTIGLKKIPKILVRNIDQKLTDYNIRSKQKQYYPGSCVIQMCSTPYDEIYYNEPVALNEKFISCKVDGDIELALNMSAGVVIDEVKASLICEKLTPLTNSSDGTHPLAYDFNTETNLDITPRAFRHLRFNYLDCFCIEDALDFPPEGEYQDFITFPWRNYEQEYLTKGIYNIVKTGDYVDNNLPRFSTPMIPADKFRNTSMTVRKGNSKLYLKLVVRMHPSDPNQEQSPIFTVVTYEIPESAMTLDAGTTPFPFTCDQQTDLSGPGKKIYTGPITVNSGSASGVVVETTGAVNFYSTSNISLLADNEVYFADGASIVPQNATALFAATIGSTGSCVSSANTLVVTPYFEGCNSITKKLVAKQEESDNGVNNKNEDIEQSISVAPNPNNGLFTLTLPRLLADGKEKISSVSVYNSIGALVYHQENLVGGNHSIDIEKEDAGIYIIMVQTASDIKTIKVVKQ